MVFSCCSFMSFSEAIPAKGFLTFNHVDIVGSISNGQCDGLLVLLYQANDVGLLLRCDAATDDSTAFTSHIDKVFLPLFLLHVIHQLTIHRAIWRRPPPQFAQA